MSSTQRPGIGTRLRQAMGTPAAGLPEPFEHLPERLRERCLREFEQGRRGADVELPALSTQRPGATRPNGSPSLPSRRVVVPASSPLIQKATADEIEGQLIPLGLAMGKPCSEEQNRLTAGLLVEAGWTRSEVDAAFTLIPNDRELIQQVDFKKAVTAQVFTLARERDEVRRGRLLTHQEAYQEAAKRDKAISDLFDVVHVEGADHPRFRMKAKR